MEIAKRRSFIINCIYFGLLLAIAFGVMRYALPLVAPFVLAAVIVYVLRRPTRFLSRVLHVPQKLMAFLLVLLFYSTIGLLLALTGIRLFSAVGDLVSRLPALYTVYVLPMLNRIFDSVEQLITNMDDELVQTIHNMSNQFLSTLGQEVSGLSVRVMGMLSNVASSLPGLFIKLLLMIISTFFLAVDYDRMAVFVMRQMTDRNKAVFLQIKNYVVGTLFVCIRSYAIIMCITFVELSIGLTVIGVGNAVLIAILIAIFDILPVLGTGGIMIPWAVISMLQGNVPMGIKLLAVYLVITVIRNIIEPKIVGSQIGLHPVLTLASMFVGAQLFGVLGLFGLPIGLSLLGYLNENGVIHLYRTKKMEEAERTEKAPAEAGPAPAGRGDGAAESPPPEQ